MKYLLSINIPEYVYPHFLWKAPLKKKKTPDLLYEDTENGLHMEEMLNMNS